MIGMVWLLFGVLSAIGVFFLIKTDRIKLKVWHWVCFAIWYLGLVFTVAFISSSFLEGEPRAAAMAALIFGGILVILAIVFYRLVLAKQKKVGGLENTDGSNA